MMRVLIIGVMLAVGSSRAAPSTAPRLLAVPDEGARAASLKMLREVYASDYKDTTPVGRKRLATKLLERADRKDVEPAARYVMLMEASGFFADAGDAIGAVDAMDGIADRFNVDGVGLKLAAFRKAVPRAGTPGEKESVATAGLMLLDELIEAMRYGDAQGILPMVEGAVGGATLNKEIAAAARPRLTSARYVCAQHQQARGSIDRADTAAGLGDEAVQLAAGRFYCFVAGQWSKGLSSLAGSSDADLKSLAKQELARPTEADKQLALADGWWQIAEKLPGPQQQTVREHAAQWYSAVLPKVSGLQKTLVEKRLAESRLGDAVVGNIQGKPVIDLMSMVNPLKHVEDGTWGRGADGALAATDVKHNRIAIAYRPPVEYDLKLVFARTGEKRGVGVLVVAGDSSFILLAGANNNRNMEVWADNVAAKTLARAPLLNNRKYTMIVRVRKSGVKVYLDEHLAGELKPADYAKLHSVVKPAGALALVGNTSVSYYSVLLIPITGEGDVVE